MPIEIEYSSLLKGEVPATSKIESLQKRKYDKLERLAPEAANIQTAEQLQQSLSDIADQQIYTRPDGSKYQIDYMIDPVTGLSQGQQEVDYTKISRYGTPDTRNLYIDTSPEGAYKLGLARSDKGFMGRYTPGEDYGWAPGPKGVTPENGALMDIELPHDVATQFEYDVHTNVGQIRSRAAGPSIAEITAARPEFGSGVSEYTKPTAPMWNIGYVAPEGQLPEDTYMPKKLREVEKKKTFKDYLTEEEARSGERAAGGEELVSGLTKSLGTAFTKELAVDTADWIGDATGFWDIGSEDEKTKMVNEWFNYDPRNLEEAHKKVSVLNNKIWDEAKKGNIAWKELGEAIVTAVKEPELLGSSLGTIAAWVVPGAWLTKGKKFADAAGMAGKASHALKAQSGQITAAIGNVNDQYEEFVKNNNDVELQGIEKAEWFATRFGVQMLNQNLDAITATSIIKSPAMFNAAKQSIAGLTEKQFGKFLAGVGKVVGTTVVNMPKEAVQEYTQRMMELTNERFGAEKFKDLDTFGKFLLDEGVMKEGTLDALMGAAGAVQFQAIGAVPQALRGAKEVVADAVGGEVDPDVQRMPTGVAGRRRVFNSDEAMDYVENEKSRDVFTKSITDYTVDLYFLPEEQASSQYAGIKDVKERNKRILDDTVEKIAKVNGLETNAEKEYIYQQVADKLKKEFVKASEKGDGKVEEKDEFYSGLLTASDDNKYVRREVDDAYREELLSNMVEFKKELDRRGVEVKDIELNPEEQKKVLKVLDRMKRLGSEELEDEARIIAEALKLAEAQDKKTVADVRREIEVTGFLKGGKNYKGLKDHTVDIEGDIVSGKDSVANVEMLQKFAESRGANEVQLFYTDAKGNRVQRNPVTIHRFIQDRQEDTQKIADTVNKLLAVENISPKIKEQLETVQKTVNDNLQEVEKLSKIDDKELVETLIEMPQNIASKGLVKIPKAKVKAEEVVAEEMPVDEYADIDVTETVIELPVEEIVVEKPKVKPVKVAKEKIEEVKVEPKKEVKIEEKKVEPKVKRELDIPTVYEAIVKTKSAYKDEIEAQIREQLDGTDKKLPVWELYRSEGIPGSTPKKIEQLINEIVASEPRYIEEVDAYIEGKEEYYKAAKDDGTDTIRANIKALEYYETRLDGEIQKKVTKVKQKEQQKLKTKVKEKVAAGVDSLRVRIMDKLNKVKELFRPNTDKQRSVASQLAAGITEARLMEMMPAVIRKAGDKGKDKVRQAVVTLQRFTKEKSSTPLPSQTLAALKNKIKVEKGDNYILDEWFSKLTEKQDKEVEKWFRVAVNVSAVIGMGKMLDARKLSSSELDDYVTGAFGVYEGTDVHSELKKKVKKGEIVPISTYRKELGQRLLKELELKFDIAELTGQDKQDVTMAIGQLVMERMKRVAKAESRYGVEGKQVGISTEAGTVEVADSIDNPKGDKIIRTVLEFKLSSEAERELDVAASVLEYAGTQDHGNIKDVPTEYKYDKKIRNSEITMPREAVKYLNKQNKKSWKFNKDWQELYKTVEERAKKEGRTVNELMYELMLDNEQELIANTPAMEIESVMAKLEADKLDVDRMLMAYDIAGEGEFYLDWDFTISGRYMISNRMLNPQNSKISRFIVDMQGQRSVLEKIDGKYDEDALHMIKVAAAQALGIGVDKTVDEKAIEELGKNWFVIAKDGKVTYADNRNARILKKAAELQEVNAIAAMKLLNQTGVMHTDEKMHVYQMLKALRELDKGSDKTEHNLALEMDGITNGMMLTLLDMGWNEWIQSMLEKGGIYDVDSEYENHGQFKVAGGQDIYEVPVDMLKKKLELGDEETAELIEQAGWRNFLKPLVMVFMYGAGINNIRRKAAEELAMLHVKNAKDVGKIKGLMAEAVGYMNSSRETTKYTSAAKVEFKQYKNGVMRSIPDGKVKDVYLSPYQMYILSTYLDEAVIGNYIENSFETEFKPVVEYRQTLKTVETMNYWVFKQQLEKKLKGKNVAELTAEQLEEVLMEMIDENTFYGANDANNGVQDYTKMGDTHANNKVHVAGFGGYATNIDVRRKEVNSAVKDFISNIGAVGVTAIHNKDGRAMNEGHIKDVLNIFDALMMGTDVEVNGEQSVAMNKSMVDVSRQHDIFGKAVEKLVGNLDKVSFEEMSEADVESLQDDLKRAYGITGDEDLDNMTAKVMEIIEKVREDRKTLGKTRLKVNHYYVSDKMGQYKEEQAGETTGIVEELGVLEDKMNEMFTAEVKVDEAAVKPEDGIIANIANNIEECV